MFLVLFVIQRMVPEGGGETALVFLVIGVFVGVLITPKD